MKLLLVLAAVVTATSGNRPMIIGDLLNDVNSPGVQDYEVHDLHAEEDHDLSEAKPFLTTPPTLINDTLVNHGAEEESHVDLDHGSLDDKEKEVSDTHENHRVEESDQREEDSSSLETSEEYDQSSIEEAYSKHSKSSDVKDKDIVSLFTALKETGSIQEDTHTDHKHATDHDPLKYQYESLPEEVLDLDSTEDDRNLNGSYESVFPAKDQVQEEPESTDLYPSSDLKEAVSQESNFEEEFSQIVGEHGAPVGTEASLDISKDQNKKVFSELDSKSSEISEQSDHKEAVKDSPVVHIAKSPSLPKGVAVSHPTHNRRKFLKIIPRPPKTPIIIPIHKASSHTLTSGGPSLKKNPSSDHNPDSDLQLSSQDHVLHRQQLDPRYVSSQHLLLPDHQLTAGALDLPHPVLPPQFLTGRYPIRHSPPVHHQSVLHHVEHAHNNPTADFVHPLDENHGEHPILHHDLPAIPPYTKFIAVPYKKNVPVVHSYPVEGIVLVPTE